MVAQYSAMSLQMLQHYVAVERNLPNNWYYYSITFHDGRGHLYVKTKGQVYFIRRVANLLLYEKMGKFEKNPNTSVQEWITILFAPLSPNVTIEQHAVPHVEEEFIPFYHLIRELMPATL